MKTWQSAAILTIYGAPDMSSTGRDEVLAWLKEQVSSFEKDGQFLFASRYRARYLYTEDDSGVQK